MDWILEHWTIFPVAFYIIEKMVHLSKSEWNDLLIDGLSAFATWISNRLGRP